MNLECHGECRRRNECAGEVRRVHVVAPDGYDWGGYNYCDTAIAEDRSNGFTVTESTRPTEGAQP